MVDTTRLFLLFAGTVILLAAEDRTTAIPATVFAGDSASYAIDGQECPLSAGALSLPVDRPITLSWEQNGRRQEFLMIAIDEHSISAHVPAWKDVRTTTSCAGFATGDRLERCYQRALMEARTNISRVHGNTETSTTMSTEGGVTTVTTRSSGQNSSVISGSAVSEVLITVAADGTKQPQLDPQRSLRYRGRTGRPQVRCWVLITGAAVDEGRSSGGQAATDESLRKLDAVIEDQLKQAVED